MAEQPQGKPKPKVISNSDVGAGESHAAPRKKRDRGEPDMELNLTSMIDVVFQLLIYFIITASFAVGEGVITAKLPQGTGSAPDTKPPERPLNIVVTTQGVNGYRIVIEGFPTAPRNFSELTATLKSMQYDPGRGRGGVYKPDNPIIIKPDSTIRWQWVVNAFNSTVAARYSNVAFAQASD